MKPEGPNEPRNHVWKEQFLCSDELSISGRFVQQALHPVTVVGCELKMQRRFGDFKVCSAKPKSESKPRSKSGGEVPDFVAVAPVTSGVRGISEDIPIEYYHELRLVGEAKTPWMHDLAKFYLPHKDKRPAQVLRHALGQIVEYMLQYKMKYGFLTTYNRTIFLKQEFREQHDNWAVYISNPIEHTTHTQHMSEDSDNSPPGTFEGKVSLRHCMLYFLKCADSDFWAENTTDLDDWIKTRASQIAKQTPATPESQIKKLSLFSPSMSDSLKENLDSERGINSREPNTRSSALNRSRHRVAESNFESKTEQPNNIPHRPQRSSTAVYDLLPAEDGNYKFFDKIINGYRGVRSNDVRRDSEGRTLAKINGITKEVNILSKRK